MTKSFIDSNLKVLVILLVLSTMTAVSSAWINHIQLKHGILLLLALIKILLVATVFMELRLAHRFWIVTLMVLTLITAISILAVS
ncbi:MAG TPA: hypothetical protein PK939_01525 [Bacteroidales bacterium]|nr:hypothetical protein [Bacteroidales bacterium]HQQ11571.1 hypothetical protein [Bacteroidales bacterium]